MSTGSEQQQSPGSPAGETSVLAILSLVFGILGWFALPVVGAIVAVVLGHLARAEIRRDPAVTGDGLALAGLVLGYVALGLAAAVILVFVAIFLAALVLA